MAVHEVLDVPAVTVTDTVGHTYQRAGADPPGKQETQWS